MKTTTKVLALALFGTLALTSCKKSFTCTCEIDGVHYNHFDYSNTTETSAATLCAADETLAQQDTGQNVQCEIE